MAVRGGEKNGGGTESSLFEYTLGRVCGRAAVNTALHGPRLTATCASAQVSAGISPDDDEDDDEEVPPPVETPVNDAVIVLSPPEPKVDPEVASKARLEGKLANIRKQLLKSQQLYGTALGGA
jgi:hypothetical protein